MPVALRTAHQKAEAKYNVTTEFPSLGLHSAAATGNIGLVEYALEHGQPINSVLDGVLPLHAACAGGNVQVVKLLIEHGADVNAPRLPRRFSNDKNRDASAPIVGSSGSTPLHFAAANGNTEVVNILLLHGAHADRSDKHGITPELLARQNGWLECADMLRNWLANKDRDLKERPGGDALDDSRSQALGGNVSRDRISSFSGDAESSQAGRKRLHVKQSIDQALNKFKSSTTDVRLQPPASSSALLTSTPPSSPTKPTGDYTLNPFPSDDASNSGPRRPSLPLQSSSVSSTRSRKTSTPAITSSPSPQRPRSAGNGAEGSEQDSNPSLAPAGRTGVRKLGSKYSLMNLFKRAQSSETGSSLDVSQTIPHTSQSASGSTTALPTSSPPKHPSPLSNPLPTTEFGTPSSRHGLRFHRGSDASSRMESISQQVLHRKISSTLTPSPRPTAVDLHNALAQERQDRHHQRQNRDRSRSTGSGARLSGDEASPSPGSSPLTRLDHLRAQGHKRDRSGSGGSLRSSSPGYRGGAVFDDDVVVVAGDNSGDTGKSTSRPSILKAHNRTSSSGYTSSAYRALRFDSSSSTGAGVRREEEQDNPGAAPNLRGSSSVGSFAGHRRRADNARMGATPEPRVSEEDLSPDSAPAAVAEFNDNHHKPVEDDDDEEEEEYGQPLHEGFEIKPSVSQLPSTTLLLEDQESSFETSSQSSLSPILPNDPQGSSLINAEFPFSINKPPTLDADELEPANHAQNLLRVPVQAGCRSRGDSVSSTSTADSRNNPQLSASGTTNSSGSGSETVTTPGREQEHFVDVATASGTVNSLVAENVKGDDQRGDGKNANMPVPSGVTLNERRYHTPPDIDISSISSHAQAELLVQKAQQDLFEMANSSELAPSTSSTGRSPLSARLAAYGESLALERRFREQKEQEERKALTDLQSSEPTLSAELPGHHSYMSDATALISRRTGVERQHSLEQRPRSKSGRKDPKRPSTAEGLSPRSDDQVGRFHHTSNSTSGFGVSPQSQLTTERDAAAQDEEETVRGHVKSASALTVRRDSSPGPRTVRSRTPLPETSHGGGDLSRISSLEGLDTDTELGPPLSRVLTAPHVGGTPRGGKTSTKLARMGFPPMEQIRAQPAASKRFGLKSIVQTLKGKS